jgi:hypothetical protein
MLKSNRIIGCSMKSLMDFIGNIFKMPVVWWPWMAGLPLVNLSSIFFLPRKEAWVLGTGLFPGSRALTRPTPDQARPKQKEAVALKSCDSSEWLQVLGNSIRLH